MQAIEILISAHFIPISNYSYSIGTLQAFYFLYASFWISYAETGKLKF